MYRTLKKQYVVEEMLDGRVVVSVASSSCLTQASGPRKRPEEYIEKKVDAHETVPITLQEGNGRKME